MSLKKFRFTGYRRFVSKDGIIYLEYVSRSSGKTGLIMNRVLTVTDNLSGLTYVGEDPSLIISFYFFSSKNTKHKKNFIINFYDDTPKYKVIEGEQHIEMSSVVRLEMLLNGFDD